MMVHPGDDPHDTLMPPPIYGTRGEEYQIEPDPPRRVNVVAWVLVGIALAAGLLWAL